MIIYSMYNQAKNVDNIYYFRLFKNFSSSPLKSSCSVGSFGPFLSR